MTIDVLLAILALIGIIVGVLGEAYNARSKKVALHRYGYLGITTGLVACLAMIYKADVDSKDREELYADLAAARSDILAATQREGSRLHPSDLQVRLLVDYRQEQT